MPTLPTPNPHPPLAPEEEDAGHREYPLRPLVGVGVVVFQGDRVLLIRRANPPKAGEWSLPGGLQRLGETLDAAVRREVAEETGVLITVAGLIEAIDLIERDEIEGRIRYHYTLIDFFAEWQAGEPCPASDAVSAAWFEPAAVEALSLWTETRRIIARAREIRRLAPFTTPDVGRAG
jgi:8-oxo-dGTP diphosphatase